MAGALALAMFLFVGSAATQGGDEYSASIASPTVTAGSTNQTLTVTITNSAGSPDPMGSAQITLDSAFSNASASNVTANGWNAGTSGDVVTLTSTSGSEIAPGASVSVDVTFDAPTAAGSYTWATAADLSDDFSATGPFTNSGSDPQITVNPGPITHFIIVKDVGDKTAGTPFDATVIARDNFGNTATGYTGNQTLTWGGAPCDPNCPGTAPDNTHSPSYPGNPVSFSGGQATVSITLFKAESPKLGVSDGTYSGTSSFFTVDPAALDHFAFDPVSDHTAGQGFSVSATAQDQYDNTVDNFTGNVTLSGVTGAELHGSPSGCPGAGNACTASSGTTNPVAAVNGVATWNGVAGYKAEGGRQLQADGSGKSGTSGTFAITHAGLDHFTFASISDQTAGLGSTVTATAEDAFENPLGSDYTGAPTLAGASVGTQLDGSLIGCSGPCSPSYGNPASVSNGVATWNGVTGYKAESGRQLKVTDSPSGKTGTSGTFAITHAGLDHFTFASISDQTAGLGFTVTATAEDAFENPLGSDYSGNVTLSGVTGAELHGSPSGCTGHLQPCSASYGSTNPVAAVNGVATWSNVTGYKAESSRQLQAAGSGKTGTSGTFAIVPAGLDHFTLTNFNSAVPETAGSPFSVDVTSFDKFDNPGANGWTSGTKCVVFSGPQNSPSSPVQTNSNKAPDYPAPGGSCSTGQSGLSFNSGVATATMTLYNATRGVTSALGTTTLTATDPATSKQGSSTAFTVNANTTAGALVFSHDPPAWVQAATTFNAATTVYDIYSNTLPGHNVNVALGTNPNGAALTCPTSASPCTVPSDTNGISSFSLRVSQDSVGFTLSASGSPSANSHAFSVADQLNPCTGNNTGNPNCTGHGGDGPNTTQTDSSVSGILGTITGDKLALSVDSSLTLPAGVCGINSTNPQLGSGTVFEITNPQNSLLGSPTWTITSYIEPAALGNANFGASHYDICLGTTNINGGTDPGCSPNGSHLSTTASWPAKGGCAVAAQFNGTTKYFGNVPDAPTKVKTCSQATSPVVLSKNKTSGGGFPNGTLKIVWCAVYPWDGAGGFH